MGMEVLRRFTLRVFGCRVVQNHLPNLISDFSWPHGFGDVGYDEATSIQMEYFEHRLLYSSGIETQIVFRGFETKLGRRQITMRCTEVADRPFPDGKYTSRDVGDR